MYYIQYTLYYDVHKQTTPERTYFSRCRIEEDRRGGDNSILKISSSSSDGAVDGGEASPDCSLRFETDAKTSTPVKKESDAAAVPQQEEEDSARAGPSRSCQNSDDVFHSFLQNA